jgi:hypothetical protein
VLPRYANPFNTQTCSLHRAPSRLSNRQQLNCIVRTREEGFSEAMCATQMTTRWNEFVRISRLLDANRNPTEPRWLRQSLSRLFAASSRPNRFLMRYSTVTLHAPPRRHLRLVVDGVSHLGQLVAVLISRKRVPEQCCLVICPTVCQAAYHSHTHFHLAHGVPSSSPLTLTHFHHVSNAPQCT